MNNLQFYKIFERKGNYQLFHKTTLSNLKSILKEGYIKCGGNEDDDFKCDYWNHILRKSVLPNWKENDKKFKTISATRNFDYLGLPALELDVEKISDKYRIIPYSENPDFYLDFKGKPAKTKLNKYQNLIRSKDKKSGKMFWRVKTDTDVMDFGIAEELILTDKLDVSKYVKRIILDTGDYYEIEKIVKLKYPHIEIVELYEPNYFKLNKKLKKVKTFEAFGGARITNALKKDFIKFEKNMNDFMISILDNDMKTFNKLIDIVDLEEENVDGNTALLIASYSGRLKMLKELIKHGANIYHVNKKGKDFYDEANDRYKFINSIKDYIEKNLPVFVATKKYNL